MTFNVTVVDTVGPVITLNGSPTIALVVGDTYTEEGATATDVVDGSVAVVVSGWTGDTSAPGNYTVKYNAVDTRGNAATEKTRTITVSDVEAPVITTPPNIVIEATSLAGALVDYVVSALDDVDGDVTGTVSCSPLSGIMFALGMTTVTCSVTDLAGNVGGKAFTVTVEDTTDPVVTVTPPEQTLEATSALGAIAAFTATALDAINGDVSSSILCDQISGAIFPIGMTTVTCSATDSSKNSSSGTAKIEVVDTTAPIITLNGDATVTLSAGNAYSDAGATAADIVDGIIPVVVGGSVDTGTAGSYTITYDATDSHGNAAAQVTRTVIVQTAGNGPIAGTIIWTPPIGQVLGASTGNTSGNSTSASNTNTGTSADAVGGTQEDAAEPASCPAPITSYIGYGADDSEPVKTLQTFLNKEMGSTLEVTGIYDDATKDVVKAFQKKYATDILAPWTAFGLSGDTPTGFVYKTTLRMIHKISCPGLEIPMPQLP